MSQPSAVEYAPSPDGWVAYRTAGSGSPAVVLVSDWFSHAAMLWAIDSPFLPVLDRLASFSHLITFDKRGVGMSDPVPLLALPTMEDWVDDVRSVLDELGIERAAIIGKGSGGPMAALFAATHPDRVESMVLVNAWARLGAADDFPIGVPVDQQEGMLATPYMPGGSVRALAGERVSERVHAWWQSYVRHAASPTTSMTMRRWMFSIDVRAALPAIRCPVLVVARADAWIGEAHANYLTEHIPDARTVLLPGSADFLFTGDTDALLDEIESHVTGRPLAPTANRVLATVLFTDVVESTRHVSDLGDRRWSQLLSHHDVIVRAALRAHSGREIATTGDGFLAVFDGPARAIRCAARIRTDLAALDLEMRAGLHAGEVELRENDDVGGIAVHIAQRVQDKAVPGEVLITRTVKDLVAGSGIELDSRGVHDLRGVEDTWELHALVDAGGR